ncbi:MFS transporter [uncultured Reyranella sp.]|jgi:metabolite-proton symporter|uniref:MFS transporter n=1 Tax=uncultured Reyranella sp. TaxID=735512 RepID=UPI00259CC7DF|nr:MFS transporter [uncultured Reyranella sp.]
MGEQVNSPARILTASLVGTTIEFFDFYIFATAAVLVFPHLFFPTSDPTSAVLQSFATFSIAFFARPLGAAVFGHYGDRIGRKATLVAALMTMGLSTVMIGFLPGYDTVGVFAPLLLAICRFGQGLGLGGEWGGAVLLATENAPPHRRSWYAMFPQLGAPLGFVLSATSFLLLTETLTNEQFLSWGWRIPFVSSLLLVLLGLYVRLKITETPEFQKAVDTEARVAVPILDLLRSHKRALLLGTLVALATFVLFYLMTVFSLSWATSKLGYSRERYLEIQLIGVAFFAATIPLAAWLSDRYGRRTVLLIATGCTGVFGLFFEPLLANGLVGALAFNVVGLALMGFNYGPIGAALASPFPVSVRYTGASMTFNLAGIFGASLAPYIATWLALNFSLAWVGYYLLAACLLTLAAMVISRDAELSS